MSQQELIALFDAYYEPVYRFVYFRVGHQQTAEDLVSHIFEKVIKYFYRFKKQQGATEKSWIFTIARNTVIDHYRTQKQTEDISDYDVADTTEMPDIALDTAMNLEMVQSHLKALTDRQREVLLLRYQSDFSNVEIAALLDIDQKTVSSILSQAIKRLKNSVQSVESIV
jgi:RNA polymerase sigma-70 factor (ECF subfamily)